MLVFSDFLVAFCQDIKTRPNFSSLALMLILRITFQYQSFFLLDTTVAHTAAIRPNPRIIRMIDFFCFSVFHMSLNPYRKLCRFFHCVHIVHVSHISHVVCTGYIVHCLSCRHQSARLLMQIQKYSRNISCCILCVFLFIHNFYLPALYFIIHFVYLFISTFFSIFV